MKTILFPLGPFHPALAEPWTLVLGVRGETVVAVEDVQTGCCVRDVLALCEGQPIADVLVLFERSCSFAGHTHRLALSRAIEDALGLSLARGAALTRTCFVEIERMLARLWILARTSRALGLARLARLAHDQREMLFVALEEATGRRMNWAVSVPGGARGDIDALPLAEALDALTPTLAQWRSLVASSGRLGTLGATRAAIPALQATRLGLGGIAAAALGSAADERRLHPSEGYAHLDLRWPDPEAAAGDLAARLRACVGDLAFSHHVALSALQALRAPTEAKVVASAELPTPRAAAPGHAQVEGPHGPVEVSLVVRPDGMVTDVELSTPAERVLAALPIVLEGARLTRVPAILASLDLCIECIDL